MNSLDIQSAFVQGSRISRDLFITPPLEACTTKVWKLQKCVYDLVDALRLWYLRATEGLETLGATESIYDEAILYCHHNGKLKGVFSTHVDNIFWGGTTNFKKNVIDMIKQIIQINKENQNNFTYLGLHIKQNGHATDVDQEGYISDINPIVIEDERNKKSCEEITPYGRQQLRAVIGQLNWVSTQTRPDIVSDPCIASVSFKEAEVKDLLKVNKAIRKLQSESVHLKFTDLGDLRRCRVINYSNASYCNLSNEPSPGGFIIFICNQHNQVAPIQW